MWGEESWFSNLLRTSRKSIGTEPENAVIGILAFEVAILMTKIVNLWQCLMDTQFARLREEIGSSFGVRKLVSDNDVYLMDLALAEMVENWVCLVKSVSRLGKRCMDPVYHHLGHVFDEPVGMDPNWCGWEYRLKKMERKVKKMERFVAVTAQLYQELEVLAELEQSFRRMKVNTDLGKGKLLEFQKKVMWQRQEVKNLRERSPWIRTYDYTVRLLLRSLFTILWRIKHVFGTSLLASVRETRGSGCMNKKFLMRSHSLSSPVLTSVHPSENCPFGFNSKPLNRSASNLEMSTGNVASKKMYQNTHQQSSTIGSKHLAVKTRRSSHFGSFGGCIPGGNESSFMHTCTQTNKGSLSSNVALLSDIYDANNSKMVQLLISKCKLLTASPTTLGGAGLALHYANIIVLIEKLASSPHLIGLDARDDLYNMLPTSIRSTLRAKLKLFAKTSTLSIYDAALAAEWSLALSRLVEWLAPLAHNMIRWHSARNFDKQHLVNGTNTLLVQTLYFADQEKTEAAVVEVLMGLNYLSRLGGEIGDKALAKSASGRACENYFLQGGKTVFCA